MKRTSVYGADGATTGTLIETDKNTNREQHETHAPE